MKPSATLAAMMLAGLALLLANCTGGSSSGGSGAGSTSGSPDDENPTQTVPDNDSSDDDAQDGSSSDGDAQNGDDQGTEGQDQDGQEGDPQGVGQGGDAEYGCAGEPPPTAGANNNPRYALIPSPAVPRVIRATAACSVKKSLTARSMVIR